jgi:uncharacterized protein YndB with AHSA1/START domain
MNHAATIPTRAIEVDYDYPSPPEKVWRLLTESDLIARWLMPNDFRLEVGHRFTFRTDPIPAAGFDGIINCQVLSFEAPKRLSYSWKGGPIDTIVTWTLTATDGGTRLHLEHSGFRPQDEMAFNGLGEGWRKMKMGGRFADLLATL